MVLNNHKIIKLVKLTIYILLTVITLDFGISQLIDNTSSLFEGHWPAKISSSLIFLFWILNVSCFSFENEYEIVQIFSGKPFSKKAKERLEFPKQIITGVEIKNGLLSKKMYLNIQTDQSSKVIGPFYLSFISPSKINELIDSLDITVRQNKNTSFIWI